MRKILALALVSFCLFVLPGESIQLLGSRLLTVAGGGCPSFGTYGTSTGNVMFAWDGNFSGAQTSACDSTESEVTGTNQNGTFGGSGTDTYFEMNADDDLLFWAWGEWDTDNPGTICIEVLMVTTTANQMLFQYDADALNNRYIGRVRGNNTMDSILRIGGVNFSTLTTTGTITDNTWTDIRFSTQVDVGNDSAVDPDVSDPWDIEADLDFLTGFTVAEDQMSFGSDNLVMSTDVTRIRRFAVIAGWEQACPSW